MNNDVGKLRNLRLGDPALVIGNSPWRAGFPLHSFGGDWVTIGCNVLFRDYAPDYLVAFDAEAIKTALLEGAFNHSALVLKAPENHGNVLEALRARADYEAAQRNVYALGTITGTEFNPGSLAGTLAIGLAGWLGCGSLTLVGFSLSDDNVYLGDKLYLPASTPAYKREPGARPGDFKPIREAVNTYRALAREANGYEPAVNWIAPHEWTFERLRLEPAAAKWGGAR